MTENLVDAIISGGLFGAICGLALTIFLVLRDEYDDLILGMFDGMFNDITLGVFDAPPAVMTEE